MQHHLLAWNLLAGFDIVVHLIVQAAFQFCAHASQFLRIERDVLETGSIGADADKVLHPCGTAELASARSCSANASSLLSRANLFHLNAYMERGCQVLDELAEVHTLVGNIVEDGFVAVALIFHVADFHVQSQVLGNLPALYHGTVLTAFGFVIFLHVHGFGNTVDALDVVGRFQIGFFHLQLHQSSCQGHHTDIVSGVSLHRHNVTFLQIQVVHVVIIAFAGILKLNLHQVGALCIAGNVGQPVVGVQLVVLPSACATAQTAVAPRHDFQFHILVVHILVISVLKVQSFSGKGRRRRFCHLRFARCREYNVAAVR